MNDQNYSNDKSLSFVEKSNFNNRIKPKFTIKCDNEDLSSELNEDIPRNGLGDSSYLRPLTNVRQDALRTDDSLYVKDNSFDVSQAPFSETLPDTSLPKGSSRRRKHKKRHIFQRSEPDITEAYTEHKRESSVPRNPSGGEFPMEQTWKNNQHLHSPNNQKLRALTTEKIASSETDSVSRAESLSSFHMVDGSCASGRVLEPLKWSSYTGSFSVVKNDDSDTAKSEENCQMLMQNLLRFFPERKLKMMTITWNMAGVSSYPKFLTDLVKHEFADELCDVYMFAFQETTSNKSELLMRLQMTLGVEFVVYTSHDNGEIFSVLMGHKDLIWNLAVLGKSSLSTRITTKTKGAVAISYQIFGTTVLFLNSHLSSNLPGDTGRNQLRVEDHDRIVKSKELAKDLINSNQERKENLFDNFHYTVWTGDLNFRLNNEVDVLLSLINAEREADDGGDYDRLMEWDELLAGQTEDTVFQEFEEARILFPPTYKTEMGSSCYVSSRKPAYTDRVLFRQSHQLTERRCRAIECIQYRSVPAIINSDHQPVSATIQARLWPLDVPQHTLNAGKYDAEIYNKCYNRSLKETSLSESENAAVNSAVCSIL